MRMRKIPESQKPCACHAQMSARKKKEKKQKEKEEEERRKEKRCRELARSVHSQQRHILRLFECPSFESKIALSSRS